MPCSPSSASHSLAPRDVWMSIIPKSGHAAPPLGGCHSHHAGVAPMRLVRRGFAVRSTCAKSSSEGRAGQRRRQETRDSPRDVSIPGDSEVAEAGAGSKGAPRRKRLPPSKLTRDPSKRPVIRLDERVDLRRLRRLDRLETCSQPRSQFLTGRQRCRPSSRASSRLHPQVEILCVYAVVGRTAASVAAARRRLRESWMA